MKTTLVVLTFAIPSLLYGADFDYFEEPFSSDIMGWGLICHAVDKDDSADAVITSLCGIRFYLTDFNAESSLADLAFRRFISEHIANLNAKRFNFILFKLLQTYKVNPAKRKQIYYLITSLSDETTQMITERRTRSSGVEFLRNAIDYSMFIFIMQRFRFLLPAKRFFHLPSHPKYEILGSVALGSALSAGGETYTHFESQRDEPKSFLTAVQASIVCKLQTAIENKQLLTEEQKDEILELSGENEALSSFSVDSLKTRELNAHPWADLFSDLWQCDRISILYLLENAFSHR